MLLNPIRIDIAGGDEVRVSRACWEHLQEQVGRCAEERAQWQALYLAEVAVTRRLRRDAWRGLLLHAAGWFLFAAGVLAWGAAVAR